MTIHSSQSIRQGKGDLYPSMNPAIRTVILVVLGAAALTRKGGAS